MGLHVKLLRFIRLLLFPHKSFNILLGIFYDFDVAVGRFLMWQLAIGYNRHFVEYGE